MSKNVGRTKKMAINSLSAGLLALITMIAGFLLPRFIIQFYGEEINGLTVTMRQFVNYLNYIELGVYPMFFTALFKPLAERDHKTTNGIVAEAKKTYFQISLIYLIILTISIFTFPLIINRGEISYIEVLLSALIFGTSGLLNLFVLSRYKVLFSADQKISIINFFDIIQVLFVTLIQLLLIKFKFGILFVLAVPIPFVLLKGLYLHYFQTKLYPYIDYKNAVPIKIDIRRRDTFLFELILSLSASLPITVLSIIATLEDVNIFAIYNLIFMGLGAMISMFTGGTTASFGNLVAEKNNLKTRGVYKEFFVLLNVITVVLFGTALFLSKSFIRMYLAGTVDDINKYLHPLFPILFVAYNYFGNLRIPALNIIRASGKYKDANIFNIISFVIQLVITVVFTYYFNIIGLLISLIIISVLKLILFSFVVEKKVVKEIMRTTLFNVIIGVVTMFGLYFLSTLLFDFNTSKIVVFVVYGFGLVSAYFIIFIAVNLAFNYYEVNSIFKRIKFLFRK